MKTVILTSSGLLKPTVREAILPYLPSRRPLKVGYVPTASKVVKDDTYALRDLAIMNELGFKVAQLELSTISPEYLQEILPQQDVVYVQGGNGFFLLKHARRTGFLSLARKLVEAGSLIYVGKSAGSYLACPTLEVHTWHDKMWDRFEVEDLTAMNLVPFLLQAHYSNEDNVAINQGMAKSKYPLKLLTNHQAIIVQNDEIKLVGEGDEFTYPFSQSKV